MYKLRLASVMKLIFKLLFTPPMVSLYVTPLRSQHFGRCHMTLKWPSLNYGMLHCGVRLYLQPICVSFLHRKDLKSSLKPGIAGRFVLVSRAQCNQGGTGMWATCVYCSSQHVLLLMLARKAHSFLCSLPPGSLYRLAVESRL